MKRILALVIGIFVVFQLVSCGNEDKPKDSDKKHGVAVANGELSSTLKSLSDLSGNSEEDVPRKSSDYTLLSYGYYNDNIIDGHGYPEDYADTNPPKEIYISEYNCDPKEEDVEYYNSYLIKPSGDYYELVLERVDSEDSIETEFKIGVLKNNEWLIKPTKKSPFLEDGWFKGREKDQGYDEIIEGKEHVFTYLGQGVFMYYNRIVYNVETNVSIRIYVDEANNAVGYKGDAGFSFGPEILGDNQTIITKDNVWDQGTENYDDVYKDEYSNMPIKNGSKQNYLVMYNLKNGKKTVLNKKVYDDSYGGDSEGTEVGKLSEGYFYYKYTESDTEKEVWGFYDLKMNEICKFYNKEKFEEYKIENIVDVKDCKVTNGKYSFVVLGENESFFNITISMNNPQKWKIKKLDEEKTEYYSNKYNWNGF